VQVDNHWEGPRFRGPGHLSGQPRAVALTKLNVTLEVELWRWFDRELRELEERAPLGNHVDRSDRRPGRAALVD
jgi:hypothetical protein